MQYRRKPESRRAKRLTEGWGFVSLLIAGFGLYCVLFPAHSGEVGTGMARFLGRFLGRGAFVLMALLALRGWQMLSGNLERGLWRRFLLDGALVWGGAALLALYGPFLFDANLGGVVGKFNVLVLERFFGRWGSFWVASSLFLALGVFWFEKTPADLFRALARRISEDWSEWKRARSEAAERGALNRVPRRPFPLRKPPVPDRTAETTLGHRQVISPSPAAKSVPTRISSPAPVPAPFRSAVPDRTYTLPSLDLLAVPEKPVTAREEELMANADLLEKTLANFGVQGKVVEIHPGPIITRYDIAPAAGVKVQSIASLSNDIALAMKALSVRVLAPIPGKAAVGIEIPNARRAIVRLREILTTPAFQDHRSALAIGLGKDAEGHPYMADLASLPHVLIAGSTGAGKSICIHSLIISLLYKSTPDQVKLLLIDPKRLELPIYNGLPYLYDPTQDPLDVRVVTDAKEAAKSLEAMVRVMDQRFKKFAAVMARDIQHFNEKASADNTASEPYIVVVIDELADLMAVAPKEVEGSIQRLAQMARAVGIHLVLATQRPSVDVLTGVIKANLPARLAFRVASQTDSRVILDSAGAECLLGEGDMLFLPPGAPKPFRIQGGFVSPKDVQAVVDFWKNQGQPTYERVVFPSSEKGVLLAEGPEDDLAQALRLVLERRRVSQDLLKAHFGSSARATDLLSLLEVKGFISKPEGTNRWTIFFDRIESHLAQGQRVSR